MFVALRADRRSSRGLIYRRLPPPLRAKRAKPPRAARARRARIVFTLAALFSLDAFAGGLVVQSLLALWLFQRFGLSLAAAARLFFWSGLLTRRSYLAAVPLARRDRAASTRWCSRTCPPTSA